MDKIKQNSNLGLLTIALLLAALAGFSYHIWYLFLQTPEAQAAAGGLAQKIFYFHVPAAYALYLSGAVCFVSSAIYLVNESPRADAWAKAGAEAAVAFGMMVLFSGPLWAKKAWGVYWTWDPRLTSLLLGVLLYISLVLLRAFSGEGQAEKRFAAAFGVLGTFLLPIIHYSVKLWGGNHPTVVTNSGGGLGDPRMKFAFWFGFLTMSALAYLLIRIRAELAFNRNRLADLEEWALVLSLDEDLEEN